MKVAPDDPVYRINTVWLGPKGLTFPWTARYLAYGIWLALFLLILAVEAVTPLSVGLPPVWEVSISVLATYALMPYIDPERPLKSIWQVFRAEAGAPRKSKVRRVAPVAKILNITGRR